MNANSKKKRDRTPFADLPFRGLFKGGGVAEGGGGFHTAVRGTMFVRNGAMTPGPSREYDITFFVKGRPKSAQQLRDSTVAVRRAQSVTVPSLIFLSLVFCFSLVPGKLLGALSVSSHLSLFF